MLLNGASSFRGLAAAIGGLASCSSQTAINETGRTLIKIARQAWLGRQIELVEETVSALLGLPLEPHVQNVARYYQALASVKSNGFDQTRMLLERLSDNVFPEYRPKILLGLASLEISRGNLAESTRISQEAASAARGYDPLSRCQALRGLALVRSFEGDHAASLADLERLFPVMRSFATSYPEDYRYYLNNLAYELGQVGRIEEARAAINVALRSPNADRFPDWADTAQEIETMRRRVFLPLVFALGIPSAPGVPAADKAAKALAVPSATESAAIAATLREQVQPEASASAQPESQPDIQTSPARVVAPTHRRNLKTSIFIVLARVTCRRVAREAPLRKTLKPTFQTSGCAQSPSARAPPFLCLLF